MLVSIFLVASTRLLGSFYSSVKAFSLNQITCLLSFKLLCSKERGLNYTYRNRNHRPIDKTMDLNQYPSQKITKHPTPNSKDKIFHRFT